MALIRNADVGQGLSDAIVLDLGDLERRGEHMRAVAKAEIKKMLAEGRAERERIVAGAHEAGHEAGYAEGKREGLEAGREAGTEQAHAEHERVLTSLEAAWRATLDGFERARADLLLEARQDVLRLALALAEKVVKRTVEVDEGVAAEQLAAILALVTAPTRLHVRIHPDDRAAVERALPRLTARLGGLEHIDLVEDASLSRGSCVAESAGGAAIDATIDGQLDRMVRALLPDGPAAERDAA